MTGDSGGREERTIFTNGVDLHVVEAGPDDGPLVILLHGFPECWFAWNRYIDSLAAAGYKVLAPDQRGYNRSSRPAGVYAYNSEQVSRDVVGLIDAHRRARAIIVGHDWGGHVAWWVAARYPDRVERLVVLNAAHPRVMFRNVLVNPRQTLKSWYAFALQLPWLPELILRRNGFARLRRMIHWDGEDSPISGDEARRYVDAWSQPHAITSMINWYRAAFRTFPLTLSRSRIVPPTLLIWGENDQFLHRSLPQQSIAYCATGRLAIVPGATHWVHHERRSVITELLWEFLSAPGASDSREGTV